MSRRSLEIAVRILLLVALLAACQPAKPTEAKTLRVWITWGDDPAQIQSLFNKYTEKTGVKVEVTAPVEDDKVLAALSSSEPPDILVLGGADSVGSWQREGLATELDPLIKSSGIDMSDFFEAPLGQCKYGGKYYCLPWGTDVYALFWNKDLFEDAGLDPEKPPETMEQLAEYADTLTKSENGSLTQVGFIPDFSWSHFDLYVRMYGGFWYSEDGTQMALTSEPVKNAFQWEQQFYSKYNPDEVLTFMSAMGEYNSPDHGFYAGKVAMMVEGEWQVGNNFIPKFKPELNYGVAPFPPPASNPERKGTCVVAGTVAVIPSGVKDKEEAAKLLAWMMSPEIVAEEMIANSNLPTSKKAAADPRFRENAKFAIFMDLMAGPNAKTAVFTSINAEVNTELGTIEEQALHAGADPLPLLEAAQTKLQAELDKVLGK